MEQKHAQLVESILQQRRTRQEEEQAALGSRIKGVQAIDSLMRSCDYARSRDEYCTSYGWDDRLVAHERDGRDWGEPHDPECFPRRYANKAFCFMWVTRFWVPAAERVKAFMSVAEVERVRAPTEFHKLSKDTFLPVLKLTEPAPTSLWPTIEQVAELRWDLGRNWSGLERFQALLAAHIYETDPNYYEYELFERELRTCFTNLGHLEFELAELEVDPEAEVAADGGKEARSRRRRSKRLGGAPDSPLEWEPRALVILHEHPDWSNRCIAEAIGVHPSQLSRSELFRAGRSALASSPREGTAHGRSDPAVDGVVRDAPAEDELAQADRHVSSGD